MRTLLFSALFLIPTTAYAQCETCAPVAESVQVVTTTPVRVVAARPLRTFVASRPLRSFLARKPLRSLFCR